MAGEEALFDSLDPKVLLEHFAEQNEDLMAQNVELHQQLTIVDAANESLVAENAALRRKLRDFRWGGAADFGASEDILVSEDGG